MKHKPSWDKTPPWFNRPTGLRARCYYCVCTCTAWPPGRQLPASSTTGPHRGSPWRPYGPLSLAAEVAVFHQAQGDEVISGGAVNTTPRGSKLATGARFDGVPQELQVNRPRRTNEAASSWASPSGRSGSSPAALARGLAQERREREEKHESRGPWLATSPEPPLQARPGTTDGPPTALSQAVARLGAPSGRQGQFPVSAITLGSRQARDPLGESRPIPWRN